MAAELSELQIDVAQGPGWDAHSTQSPVCVPDLDAVPAGRWPLYLSGVSGSPVHAVYSFPLSIGGLRIGAVDLYSESTATFADSTVVEASVLADAAATGVLRYSLQHRHGAEGDDGPHSRREVHQATGMVIAQMQVDADDALLLIRAHAFASGRSVRETAADITSRRISLEP
ncbi:MAG: ANTAR domain-containing protein [Herbiconiux sp.]|nr:ANTAR domain-containing protein [Herbiconiux sp.]